MKFSAQDQEEIAYMKPDYAFAATISFLIFAIMLACTPTQKREALTALDVARAACELFAVGESSKMGVTPADAAKALCATGQQLAPWIEANASAAKFASAKASATRGDGGTDAAHADDR